MPGSSAAPPAPKSQEPGTPCGCSVARFRIDIELRNLRASFPANIPFARSASIGIYCAPMSDVTQLLSAIEAGDSQAAHQLLPLVYDELRKLAVVRMANEKAGQTLQPTALVHEAWLKIAGNDALETLALEDPQAAEVVRMRYFVGMTVPEIADALELAPRTVDRHWAFARAWLKRTIRASLAGPTNQDDRHQ